MANNTIAVLRQMLASLDDAKKYQSLRDVMSTMNAPDLAAVFEDLPEEKMPVLFRLCPKDLAADVFAELSSETQEALIRGLTDRELKMFQNIHNYIFVYIKIIRSNSCVRIFS